MCDSCGCGDRELVPVELEKRILEKNDRIAKHNREHFEDAGILCVNLMGSPGAGKTALLEATAHALRGSRSLVAIAGDLATDNDADRLNGAGIRSVSINTGSACHLDAEMVHHGVHKLEPLACDYLFVENVGNLVCPAIYDLGQAVNVVALSVTEGEDKPLKYPVMFQNADLVVLTKIDLLPYLPHVSLHKIHDNLSRVMPSVKVIGVSAKSGDGIGDWAKYLEDESSTVVARGAHETVTP